MPHPADETAPEPTISESQVGGMFAAADAKPGRGTWRPPFPEELQREFPLYEIRAILGRGGMGAVYKGWQKNLERVVAIKILPPGFDDGILDFAERFKREARSMAQLNHPGIVAVYDAGETESGLLYFVMECIEGTDVHRLLAERGRVDPGEALRITAGVCDALAYAHKHGVIHRDIKPSNIMIQEDGTVKVADFGLAKSTSSDSTTITVTNVLMGTLEYMAPEALKGASHADHRADIYAVGVMLYQMLTGQVPRGRFVPPSLAVPGLDRRLDRIVDRALQTEPSARYTCASDFAAAIDPVTRRIAMRLPVNDTEKPARKKKTLVWVAVLAAIGAVALLASFQPWKKGGRGGTHPPLSQPGGKKADADSTPIRAASKAVPFINSLGQPFVPVAGTSVLFCKWETRVQDYAAFAKAVEVDDSWKKQQTQKGNVPVSFAPEHPVTAVNWEEAGAFCKWLTEKEHAAGTLPAAMRYRLPTDEEWSRAVGLAKEVGATPKARSGGDVSKFPWGTDFPPSKMKVGNYSDSTYHEKLPAETEGKWITGYTDGFATTAPVGSFDANEFGLHDLGGNVWEWCEDFLQPGTADRVVRGASWVNFQRTTMLSSMRFGYPPLQRIRDTGFRVVLDLGTK